MKENESFDEFYAKLKDIVNLAFNLGETILEPKIVRKVLRSLPERFHARISVMIERKDIDKISLTELVGNLQTYELGLIRIGKSSKGKSMIQKAKSSDTNESSNDEDFKMKSYIMRQFKKFTKNANGKGFDKDRKQSSLAYFKNQDKGKKDAREAKLEHFIVIVVPSLNIQYLTKFGSFITLRKTYLNMVIIRVINELSQVEY